MNPKPRLDELLVQRGFFEDVHAARAAVLAGEVIVGEHRETSAGKRLSPDVELRLKSGAQPAEFASRAGKKLDHALDAFSLDVHGMNCVDLGASTGGFTDCLLQRGAAHVSAVDVNYSQFSWRLRNDSRVSLFERTNVRGIDVAECGGPFDLVVADLSFISLGAVFGDMARLAGETGTLVTLVKPQFEARREDVGEGGLISDANVHCQVLTSVVDAARENGFSVLGLTFSPLPGRKSNNLEFLLWAKRGAPRQGKGVTIGELEIRGVVEAAHRELRGNLEGSSRSSPATSRSQTSSA